MHRILPSAAAVLCLALGMPVLAQDEAAIAVDVIGLETCTNIEMPTCEVVDGVKRCRDGRNSCSDMMSDARVRGTYDNTLHSDCLVGGGCRYWGTHALETPKGGWDCTFSGLSDPCKDSGNDGLVHAVCPGSGAYEGLTYEFFHVWGPDGTFGDNRDIHGQIYPDEVPPLDVPADTEE